MGNSPEGDDLSARASILKTPSATTCSPVRNIVNKLIENVFTPDHVIQTECSSSLPHKSELEGKVKTEKPELKSPGHRELDRKDGAVKSAIEVVDLMSDSDEANASNKGTQAMLKPSPSSATKMDSFPPQKTQFSPEREMQEELKTGVDDCRDASKSPAGNQNTEACPKQFDLGARPQEPSSNQMTPVATRGNSAFPPPESPSENDIPGASLETSSKLVREESCKDFEAQSPFEPENEEPVFKSSFDHFQLGDVVDSKTANPKVVGLSPTPSPLRKDPHRQNLGNQSMVKHESKPSSSPSGKDSNHPPNSKSAIIVLQDSIPARGIAKKGGSDAETKQNMALVDMRANDKHILFQATNTVLQTGVSHLEKKLVSNIQDHSRKFSVDGNTSQNKPPGDTNQNPTSAISAPFYNKERAEEQRKMSVDPNRRMAYSMQHKRGSEDTPGAGEVGAKSKVTADSTPVKAHEDIGTGNKSLVIGANNRNGKFISPNETRRDSASPDQTDRRRNGSDKKKSGSRTEAVRNKELEGRRASENKEHATIERMKSPNETRAAKSNLEPEANALISKKRHTDVLPGDLDISNIAKNREEPPMKRHKSIEMRTTPPRKAKKRERGASSSPKHQKKPYSKELSSLKSLKGTTFSGHSELSTLFSHKVIATIGGRKYTGWVLDSVNTKMSTEELKFRNEEERKKRANGGMEPGVQTPPKNSEKDIAVDLIPETRSPETCELKRDLFLTANGRPESALAGSVIQRSVIVIGAGIAGIAAARVLSDRGFKVTILEGRGRIGGRIATDWSSGFPVDLGAAYIHGTYGNPLSEVAQAADLPTFVPKDVDTLLYADGKKVSRDLDELAENVWKALLQRAAIVAKMEIMKQKDIDISLGKLLNRLKINVKGGCSKELDRLLGWHASNLEMACASELNQLSAKHYDMDDRAGFSGSHKLVRDGFSSIVYTLARDLDIRCGSRVVCIQRDVSIKKQADSGQAQARESGRRRSEQSLVNSPANMEASDESEPTKQTAGVRVITEDGYEHLAESCIITTPLGVLQSEDIAFFPPLPQKKRVAISNVGFGLVNKVVLHFETPFWSVISDSDLKDQNHSVKSGKTVGRVDRTNIAESDFQQHEGPDQLGRVAVKQGVFSFFLSLWRCVGAPILVAVVTGEFAEFIERCSDKEVVDMALKALWDMFPRNPPSRLVSHVVTRWKADRFSRGSYSFAKVGTSPQDYIEISKPVGKLYFAGEATHRDHPATAHGAYMSGIREAARIIARSGLDESLRKQYARELFLMQNPLSSLENNNINGDMMNSIPSKQTSGNANGSVSQKRSNSRTPRKRKKGKRVE